ncbi:hypothetical protein BDV19DRAFT_371031 [Aspergillus venezuelensis]
MPNMPIDSLAKQRENERSKFKRRQDRLTTYIDGFGKIFKLWTYLLVKSQDGKLMTYRNGPGNHWPPRVELPQKCYTPGNLQLTRRYRSSRNANINY